MKKLLLLISIAFLFSCKASDVKNTDTSDNQVTESKNYSSQKEINDTKVKQAPSHMVNEKKLQKGKEIKTVAKRATLKKK